MHTHTHSHTVLRSACLPAWPPIETPQRRRRRPLFLVFSLFNRVCSAIRPRPYTQCICAVFSLVVCTRIYVLSLLNETKLPFYTRRVTSFPIHFDTIQCIRLLYLSFARRCVHFSMFVDSNLFWCGIGTWFSNKSFFCLFSSSSYAQ